MSTSITNGLILKSLAPLEWFAHPMTNTRSQWWVISRQTLFAKAFAFVFCWCTQQRQNNVAYKPNISRPHTPTHPDSCQTEPHDVALTRGALLGKRGNCWFYGLGRARWFHRLCNSDGRFRFHGNCHCQIQRKWTPSQLAVSLVYSQLGEGLS